MAGSAFSYSIIKSSICAEALITLQYASAGTGSNASSGIV